MKYVFFILCFCVVLAGAFSVFQRGSVSKSASDGYLVSPSIRIKPIVAVVPHHDIVKEKRRELLRELSLGSQPETFLVVSPNHFGAGRKPVLTTDYAWQLQGGAEHMNADEVLVRRLFEEKIVEKNTDGMRSDHGITNLLGDIHEFFPKSRIVPILLRDTIIAAEVKRLVREVYEVCEGRCSVIASVDMSHYQTARAADMHDVKTIRALEMLDDEAIWSAEVDSRASLAFLMDWSRRFSLSRFNLFSHTNSGELTRNYESETTSHIFGYYESGERRAADSEVTFTIAGGVSSCRAGQSNNEPLSDFGSRALWGTDFSFVFWDIASEDFFLKDRLTQEWHWRGSSVQAGMTMADGVYVQRLAVGDKRLAFISADADNTTLETTIQYEKSMREFVIVLSRWQEDFSSVRHTEEQHEKALSWVRAGAGMIASFHEGGLQDMEVIDGTPVFYSVGGFLDGCGETSGLVINGTIDGEKLNLVFDPVQSEGFDIKLASGKNRDRIFQRLCLSEIPGCSDGYLETQKTP